ncbi:MAG: response regulator transcription factor [Deltaproteobacteria bacterium]|nr:response regulator transcription factor [Deltaproteobacteria bacterium]
MEAQTPASKVRVLVVEDQVKILKSQLKLLEASPDLEIVGTALSGEAALEEVEKLKPDVLLCDLGLPRMSGIDVTRAVKAKHPGIEILIFTIFDEEEKVLDAVRAGASGYLLKGAAADKIVDAIKEVRGGGTVIQPNLARRLLKHFKVEPADAAAPAAPQPIEGPTRKLSDREQEILQLIAKGVSNAEAAQMLNVSRATIRTHLEHIYQKLEVTNRVEAVTEGIRKGLINT